MAVNTTQGSTLYIGTTAAIDESSDAQAKIDFAADTYIEVGEVEDIGEFGDESEEVTFTAIADGRVRKFKGPRDAGTMSAVSGRDTNDEGQDAMLAAEAENLNYNFKVVANDKVTLGGDDSIRFFRGQVMSKRENFGNVSNITRITFNIGINTPIYTVPAT